ncbi:MAG: WYL domain-containing protein, partial [Clostridiaceae bacterium]|nr:WYL domain-containing protein [Clostridiaceae bacterium]
MARTSEQKLKILYVKEFLENFSDEQNPVSTKEIIAYLEEKGIKAERKSIYDDIAALIHYGLDIIKVGGQGGGYYLGQRPLELAE